MYTRTNMESALPAVLPRTAGKLASPRIPTISTTATIAEAKALLVKQAEHFESMSYIYVLNRQRLVGVFSVREVFRLAGSTKVSVAMTQPVIHVGVGTKQERVALLALQHNLKQIPVVDSAGKFMGAVTNEMLLQIVSSESLEDFFHVSGVYHNVSFEHRPSLTVSTALKHRLPWLVIGLAGGVLAAGIISQFENVLSQNLILAAFIPLIVYMADAVGAQMEAFIIRDLAIEPKLQFWRYFFKQAVIIGIIGLCLSVILYGASLFLYQDYHIASVLAVSLFVAISTTIIAGLTVPYLLHRIGFDPADASGPIATIIQDVISVLVYLEVATLLL